MRLLFVVAAMMLAVACGADASDSNGAPSGGGAKEPFAIISGHEYTCQTLIGGDKPCASSLEKTFDDYRKNFDAFVNSNQLGQLDRTEFSTADRGRVGLLACNVQSTGGTKAQFVATMSRDFSGLVEAIGDGVPGLTPAWNEAARSLCPGASSPAKPATSGKPPSIPVPHVPAAPPSLVPGVPRGQPMPPPGPPSEVPGVPPPPPSEVPGAPVVPIPGVPFLPPPPPGPREMPGVPPGAPCVSCSG